MKSQINFKNVARIVNLREWGVRGDQNERSNRHVNFLNDLIFTESDFFHFYDQNFERFFNEMNDFEHSVEYWFAVWVSDIVAKSKTNIQFDNFLFFIQDLPSNRRRTRYSFNLYQALNFEQRSFLLKILFINEFLPDLERTKFLKTIPIEVTEAVVEKELNNEFNGDLSRTILEEIKTIINSTK
jgi:hypothetical protein